MYNIPGATPGPAACQVCSPIHPNPSPQVSPHFARQVVVSRDRTPDLTFNTLVTPKMLPVALHIFTVKNRYKMHHIFMVKNRYKMHHILTVKNRHKICHILTVKNYYK